MSLPCVRQQRADLHAIQQLQEGQQQLLESVVRLEASMAQQQEGQQQLEASQRELQQSMVQIQQMLATLIQPEHKVSSARVLQVTDLSLVAQSGQGRDVSTEELTCPSIVVPQGCQCRRSTRCRHVGGKAISQSRCKASIE